MKNIHTLVLILFTALVLVFFHKTLSGKIPVPSDSLIGLYHPWRDYFSAEYPRGMPFKNFLITDPVRQLIPWKKTVISQWKNGEIPGWDPYSFSGTSLRGNIQAAAFYPFNILFFFLPFNASWTLLIILQPMLAGIFMYIFLTSRKLHPLASLTGAVTWGFSGVSIAWLTWGTIGHTILWLPLMLLATDRIVERPAHAKSWSVLLALLWTLSFLAGHAQIFLYCFAANAGYFLRRMVLSNEKKYRGTIYATIILSVVLFAAISAIQWVPMLPGIGGSSRLANVNWHKEGWFLPWEHLVQFVVPDFFGNPATLNYWGKWNYGEFIGYIGIVQVYFILYAVINVFRKYKSVLIPTGIILLFLLRNPIGELPYILSVPVISSLQPTRLLGILVFLFVLFSSFGLHVWLTKKGKDIIPSILVFTGIFVFLWIIVLGAGFVSHDGQFLANIMISERNLILPTATAAATVILLVAVSKIGTLNVARVVAALFLFFTVIDLYRFGWKFTPFTEASIFFPQTKILEYLAKQPKPFRIMAMDDRILPPNTSGYYGIESIEGYDPIYPSLYETFIASAANGAAKLTPPYGFDRIITLRRPDSAVLKLLNVRYVLTFTELPSEQFALVMTEGETKVYEFTGSLPRAFFVDKAIEQVRNTETLERLFMQEFSPEKMAYHVGPLPHLGDASPKDSVTVTAYSDNAMVLTTQTESDRLLFISMPYTKAWKAMIDGNMLKIYRINYLFMGVVVPGGTHTIELLHV